jgi:DNA-binding transcriptional ArsR family regulator
MSPPRPDAAAARRLRRSVPVFAALADETRLSILSSLGRGTPLSIASLSEGSPLTRQAITKHLHVLQDAGLVSARRKGRERLFRIEPKPLADARAALDRIAAQWDDALERLKAHLGANP